LSGFSTCRSGGARLVRAALALALTSSAGLASEADAGNAERSMSQYLRNRWDNESGFPGGPIYALTQTADGYLWIGAEKGLVRFDGLSFRLFEAGSGVGAGPAVLGLAAAPDGSLWARLRGAALLRFHKGIFRNILPDIGVPDSVISAMSRGRHDAMLLAPLGHGAVVFRGGRWEPIAIAAAMPSSSFVISAAEASNGDIWLGTRDSGLLRVQGSRVTRLTDGLPDLKINCLLAGDAGEVWIGTDRGLARWDGTEITVSGIPVALQKTAALNMIRGREDTIWIAAGSRGLLRVNNGVVRSAPQAGSPGHVATVFEDRDGNLWVGTDRGLERWRDPVFTTYSVAQGMPADSVGPVYPDEAGRVWFGPSSGGLFWIRDGVITRAGRAGIGDDVVYSIHGTGGDVWIGRQRGGVTRLRLRGDAITAEHFTKRQGLAQDNVFAIRRARDGTVWAGTLSGGASLFKDGRFATYDTRHGLASNTVTSILESRDGTMWFGTPNGLSAFSRGGWRTYVANDGLPSNDINTLFEDRAGLIWVGTTEGIALVEAGQMRTIGASTPQLRGSVVGFAEDRRGSLWVNVADHLLSVDREALLHGALDDGDVREYGVADGLLGVESVKRYGTVVADSTGHIWFALTRGLSVADPVRAERSLPALTLVEEVTADGASIDVQGAIQIPSSRRRLTFSYAGLSLSAPERVRYRYRLDGFDGAWSDPVAERQAVYTNLAPGQYRFRVIASNSDGLWNGAEAALPIEIQPMFWQTSWFQVSAVVLALLAGRGMYRLRMRQVARQLNVRFEERLAERTHIAQELHDTLLQGFVSASMQLHVAADRLPDDSPAKSSLVRVLDLMGKVIDEGRNAVRGLRSAAGGPHELEQAFARVPQEVAARDAAFRVIVEGCPRSLKPIIRDEVYRIGREGLVNAFRHSEATSIEIEVEYGSKELRLFVRDNGCGIDGDVIKTGRDGHWGITGMRERAQRIGGTLKIRSRTAAGTEVELRIPAQVAY
jgi:signal transduction histidine kinase